MGAAEAKKLIKTYFKLIATGSPKLPDLLADDVTWWVPPGSDMAGLYEGKAKVLELMGSGVGLYDQSSPMVIDVEEMVAEGNTVCVQFVLSAKTAKGRDYRNHYHFVFKLRRGKISAVKEYVDTKYAHDVLVHMKNSWIHLAKGQTPRQAHVAVPKGLKEEEIGRGGFHGRVANLYRKNEPTGWIRVEGDFAPGDVDGERVDTTDRASARGVPTRLFWNDDLTVSASRRSEPMPYFARNADADELWFVHRGEGTFETEFGPLEFRPGDYLVLPKGVTHRVVPQTRDNYFLVVESRGEIGFIEHPNLGRHNPFDPDVIGVPEPKAMDGDGRAEYEVRVKRDGRTTSFFYPQPPVRRGRLEGRPVPVPLPQHRLPPGDRGPQPRSARRLRPVLRRRLGALQLRAEPAAARPRGRAPAVLPPQHGLRRDRLPARRQHRGPADGGHHDHVAPARGGARSRRRGARDGRAVLERDRHERHRGREHRQRAAAHGRARGDGRQARPRAAHRQEGRALAMAFPQLARYPAAGPSLWSFEKLPDGVRVEPMPLLAEDGGESHGTLFTRGGERCVALFMHPRGDMQRHYAMPRLLEAGIATFGQAGRFINNDVNLIHERLILDVAAAIRRLRERGFAQDRAASATAAAARSTASTSRRPRPRRRAGSRTPRRAIRAT